MVTEPNNVSEFYDDFSKKQIKTGINIRHYYLAKRLKYLGIKNAKSVFEIGCGIGTFTRLISKSAKKAKIVGIDISKENIKYAKQWHKDPRFDFFVSDFSKKIDIEEKFDFVVLADVLEHIPFDTYPVVFSNLDKITHADSIVFINIPHPEIIKYIRRTNPDALQVIDQSVTQDVLFPQFIDNNFIILKMEEYNLTHYENDYVLYVLGKTNRSIKSYRTKGKYKIIIKKFFNRI